MTIPRAVRTDPDSPLRQGRQLRRPATLPEGRNLVYICDGTLSSIAPGEETNAGLLLRLLLEIGKQPWQKFAYDRGIQGHGWQRWANAATGNGLNLSILRGYLFLATRYAPGDRIFLFGYSRGAYAIRSLAGMIGWVGLIRAEHARRELIERAFELYQERSVEAEEFRARVTHPEVHVRMLGAWDTVKALGLPFPVLSRLSPMATEFHDHRLGPHIDHGYHALAADEDRTAFAPIKWERSDGWQGRLEQAWFPGTHADIGGEVRTRPGARGLSNISLNWMLRRAEAHGLVLPSSWEKRFPENPLAPSVGNRKGIAGAFLLRAARVVGGGDGEVLHLALRERQIGLPRYRPRAKGAVLTA